MSVCHTRSGTNHNVRAVAAEICWFGPLLWSIKNPRQRSSAIAMTMAEYVAAQTMLNALISIKTRNERYCNITLHRANSSPLITSSKMQAAVVVASANLWRSNKGTPPSPAAGPILVKTEACGVCHTDLHAARGD